MWRVTGNDRGISTSSQDQHVRLFGTDTTDTFTRGQATWTKRPHLYKNGQNLTRKYITISSRMRQIESKKEKKKSRAGPEKGRQS